MSQTNPAILVLADGTVFQGIAIGATGSSTGEVVFKTSMTGYQEILTDPSYCKQIVTLTCPHIGNVGVNSEDVESRQVFASGLVIRDLSLTVSNWRNTQTLSDYLKDNQVVAIAGIDTRKLTRILREKARKTAASPPAPIRLQRWPPRAALQAWPAWIWRRLQAAINPMPGQKVYGSWVPVIVKPSCKNPCM